MPNLSCKRVLLKLSGELLLGKQPFGIDQEACKNLAESIVALKQKNKEVGIVIGGGNIFRGCNLNDLGMERTHADQVGMLATLMNGLSLLSALKTAGCKAALLTALECPRVAESYTLEKALRYFEEGYVVIFVGGTGNPFFSTDTAAAMRACEIHADLLLKATKVDGIYDKDPMKHKDAVKYSSLTYSKVLTDNLGIMDATSIALCRSNQMPILVFNMEQLNKREGLDALLHHFNGTTVN